jgi:hypothetical protein
VVNFIAGTPVPGKACWCHKFMAESRAAHFRENPGPAKRELEARVAAGIQVQAIIYTR